MEKWLLWMPRSRVWVTVEASVAAFFMSQMDKRVRLGTDGLTRTNYSDHECEFFVEQE